MKKINPTLTKISTITGFALGAFALSVLASGTVGWNPPTATPPNGNVDAPISVGGGAAGNSYSQTKTGFLTLANFIFNPTLTQGDVASGSVLTALDNNGTVGWGNGGCSGGQSYTLPVSGDSGNNATIIKTLLVLQPGTYTFSGSGTTNNEGGGGLAGVFLSTNQYSTATPIPTEVSQYSGVTSGTGSQYKFYYGTGNPLIWLLERNGNNDGAWTIPTGTSVTITQTTYVYLILGQAGNNGYVYVTSSSGGSCGGNTTLTDKGWYGQGGVLICTPGNCPAAGPAQNATTDDAECPNGMVQTGLDQWTNNNVAVRCASIGGN